MINGKPEVLDRIELQSDWASIHIVEGLIDKVSSELNMPEDGYGNVLIAVTEALNNAIMHGNQSVVDKKIIVKVVDKGDKVSFIIEDEGKGFDFENLPDPTAPENIEKPNGRGVFLMRSLADEVVFHNTGNSVEISFLK
jgi:serine/threonine-protein kinase RsbW